MQTGSLFLWPAPRRPEELRSSLERCAIDIRDGSCAAAACLGRQVLVADVSEDHFLRVSPRG